MSQAPWDAGGSDLPGRGSLSEPETLSSPHLAALDVDESADTGRAGALRARVERFVPAWLRLVAVAAAAVGLLAGHLWWTSGGTQARPLPATSASAFPSLSAVGGVLPVPAPGRCFYYSRETEGTDTQDSAPVPCSSPHDAVTVAVVDHPDVDLPFLGSTVRSTRAMVACQRAAEHYLGIGPGVTFSKYSSSVYEPDDAQMAAGQRWLRCDLVEFPTFVGLMQIPPSLQGSLQRGPDLTDAYCVSPDAVVNGLPAASTMAAPELGDWAGRADCVGTQALVAVRRAAAGSRSEAASACARESRQFRGLGLVALAPPQASWTGEALCVAHIDDYETWLAKGKPLS